MFLSVKKHKNLCLSVFFVIVLFFIYKLLFPVASALTLGFFSAYLLQKPIIFLETTFRIPRGTSAFFLLFALLSLLILFVLLFFTKLYREIYFYYDLNSENVTPFLKTFLGFFKRNLSLVLSRGYALFTSMGSFFPKAIIFAGVFFFSAFYLSRDLSKLSANLTPDSFLFTLYNAVHTILSGYLKLYSLLFLFTLACLFLSFTLLKVNMAFTLSFLISIFDALPALGIGIIMIPWGIFEYLSSNEMLGISLVIVFIVITVIKEFIKPKILGDFVGLNPLLSFVAISSGYLMMGITGVFFFPFSFYVILESIKNNRRAQE